MKRHYSTIKRFNEKEQDYVLIFYFIFLSKGSWLICDKSFILFSSFLPLIPSPQHNVVMSMSMKFNGSFSDRFICSTVRDTWRKCNMRDMGCFNNRFVTPDFWGYEHLYVSSTVSPDNYNMCNWIPVSID